jgi:hypothetical protein
MAEKMDA